MNLSDIISAEILRLLEESEESTAEIQRNEFASILGCSPSQINYVLSSRFNPEHGFIIESRRGGGGYIKIKRVIKSRSNAIMHIINSIGNGIDSMSARVVIDNCLQSQLIDQNTARLMASAISTGVMNKIPPIYKELVRAAILKEMLMTQL